jgi:hypothetical protein
MHPLMAIKIIFQLEYEKFDIKTGFLCGKFDVELSTMIPYGYTDFFKGKDSKVVDTKKQCLEFT